jgi:hypothetical protein
MRLSERLVPIREGVVMKSRYAVAALSVLVAVCAHGVACTEATAPDTPVGRAFDTYEAIRRSLADDTMDGVRQEAAVLVPLAGQIAGEEAQAAASRLAAAETLNSARLEFIAVSSALVPMFLEARLPGVRGYQCAIKDRGTATWAQRSERVQNPYFGKLLPNCGEELPTPR